MATTEIAGSYESESRGIQGQDSVEKKLAALRRAVEARIHTARDSYIPPSEISWLQDALRRTERFYRDGSRGPVAWVLAADQDIPGGAFVGGITAAGNPAYVARAYLQNRSNVGTLQVGRASRGLPKGATAGYGWFEYDMNIYEVLVASPDDVQWLHSSGQLDISALGARPVEGGYEAPAGEPLYVAQAHLAGAWRPGKHSAQLGGAFIPFDGKEIMIEKYRILCYV